MANGVRFIRVHGRVVPIREKSQNYARSAKIGAVAGTFHGAAASLRFFGLRGGNFVSAVGSGIGLGQTVSNVRKGINAKKGQGLSTFVNHTGATLLGSLGGTILGAAGVAGSLATVSHAPKAVSGIFKVWKKFKQPSLKLIKGGLR